MPLLFGAPRLTPRPHAKRGAGAARSGRRAGGGRPGDRSRGLRQGSARAGASEIGIGRGREEIESPSPPPAARRCGAAASLASPNCGTWEPRWSGVGVRGAPTAVGSAERPCERESVGGAAGGAQISRSAPVSRGQRPAADSLGIALGFLGSRKKPPTQPHTRPIVGAPGRPPPPPPSGPLPRPAPPPPPALGRPLPQGRAPPGPRLAPTWVAAGPGPR